MKFGFPKEPPGIHPSTAALTRILAYKKVRNPANEAYYSEAMLLGVGGGLDTGYVLYQFQHLTNPIIVLGFRNLWNQTLTFLEQTAQRLNLEVAFKTFTDESEAEKALQYTLKKDDPAIVWVDKASLPYHSLPSGLQGMNTHQVTVYGRDGRLWRLYIDDLSIAPIEIREKIVTAARKKLPEKNFLMMVYKKAGALSKQDLETAIREGIYECALQLTRPIQTIGISNLDIWARKLTDRHDHMGWPQIFKDPKGLFRILCTVYEDIKLNGTEGFALRKLYSNFLHEAAGIVSNPALNGLASHYLQLANHWSNLAENALPSNIPVFDRVKKLMNKKYQAFRKNDYETHQKTYKDLETLAEKIEMTFPLNKHETYLLFERLSSQVKLIAELELSAARRMLAISRSNIR